MKATIMSDADIHLSMLSMWVCGRQFPDASDFWDGNWLNVHVRIDAWNAVVEASGAILRADELGSFVAALEHLDLTLAATLECMEPNLRVELSCNSLGHVAANVSITPDPLTQSHDFVLSLDQTVLKPLIADCRKVLSRYPVIGAKSL